MNIIIDYRYGQPANRAVSGHDEGTKQILDARLPAVAEIVDHTLALVAWSPRCVVC